MNLHCFWCVETITCETERINNIQYFQIFYDNVVIFVSDHMNKICVMSILLNVITDDYGISSECLIPLKSGITNWSYNLQFHWCICFQFCVTLQHCRLECLWSCLQYHNVAYCQISNISAPNPKTEMFLISSCLWSCLQCHNVAYCQISNISCTKSKNWNVSHLVLQLSLCNILKPGVKSRMKM